MNYLILAAGFLLLPSRFSLHFVFPMSSQGMLSGDITMDVEKRLLVNLVMVVMIFDFISRMIDRLLTGQTNHSTEANVKTTTEDKQTDDPEADSEEDSEDDPEADSEEDSEDDLALSNDVVCDYPGVSKESSGMNSRANEKDS